jgi:hypothetical protein
VKGRVVWVVSIPIELDEDFRKTIQTIKPNGIIKRGDLKESVEEAIHDWIRKKRQGLN